MFRTLRIASCGLSMSLLAAFGASAQAQDINSAIALVEQFIDAHRTSLDTRNGPLLNNAQAAAPYVVDGLAVDGLQGQLGFDPVYNDARMRVQCGGSSKRRESAPGWWT